jgi:hypothetical protein
MTEISRRKTAMTDYGHNLIFGTFITSQVQQPQAVVDLVKFTEQAGLDMVTGIKKGVDQHEALIKPAK